MARSPVPAPQIVGFMPDHQLSRLFVQLPVPPPAPPVPPPAEPVPPPAPEPEPMVPLLVPVPLPAPSVLSPFFGAPGLVLGACWCHLSHRIGCLRNLPRHWRQRRRATRRSTARRATAKSVCAMSWYVSRKGRLPDFGLTALNVGATWLTSGCDLSFTEHAAGRGNQARGERLLRGRRLIRCNQRRRHRVTIVIPCSPEPGR